MRQVFYNGEEIKEEELVEIIQRVVNRAARKYKFGYHSIEDIKQQGYVFAIEGLEKYDGERPLENFLSVHVKNRLYNFKRNNYSRPEKPCISCEFFKEGKCTAFDNQEDCNLYSGWLGRNDKKKSLMSTVDSDNVAPTYVETDTEKFLDQKRIFTLIDLELPVQFREDWLRLINKLRLPKIRKEKLIEAIHDTLKGYDVDLEEYE